MEETQVGVTVAQAAYIAGLIDGEGYFQIAKKQKHHPSIWYSPLLAVTNTNAEVLHWLRGITGVGFVVYVNRPSKPNWKPLLRWEVHSRQLRRFLPAVMPFLRIKRTHAELVYDLLLRQKGGAGRRLTSSENQEREQLRNRLKQLNVRGTGLQLSPRTREISNE